MYEIVDNAIDEALAGFCKHITVTINPGNSITVTDDGRGIPVDIQAQTGRPAMEVVFTVLHAGGKFGGGGYKVSGGLHGVGASVVNALSQWLQVQVHKNGKIHQMRFERGVITQNMTIVGDTDHTGTTVTFQPDPEMFDSTELQLRDPPHPDAGGGLPERRAVHHHRRAPRPGARHGYHALRRRHPGVCLFGEPVQGPVSMPMWSIWRQQGRCMAEVALQYNDGYSENIVSFANNVHTPEGGMHEEGFKRALTTVLNNYGKKKAFSRTRTKYPATTAGRASPASSPSS